MELLETVVDLLKSFRWLIFLLAVFLLFRRALSKAAVEFYEKKRDDEAKG